MTEEALTGRVLTEAILTTAISTTAILTTAIPTGVRRTVSQEDQWMPVGRLPWTGLHSHQDLIPWTKEVQCLQDLLFCFQIMTADLTTA